MSDETQIEMLKRLLAQARQNAETQKARADAAEKERDAAYASLHALRASESGYWAAFRRKSDTRHNLRSCDGSKKIAWPTAGAL